MSVTFDNSLRNDRDALQGGRYVIGALRQEPGCFHGLDNIHPQGIYAVSMQIHKFSLGHLGGTSCPKTRVPSMLTLTRRPLLDLAFVEQHRPTVVQHLLDVDLILI